MKKSTVQIIDTGYKPRKLQARTHRMLKRFNVLIWHRRCGKTVFCINHKIHKGLENSLHNPQYAYIAPTYKQAKMVAWEYLTDYCRNIPGFEANKSELTVYIHRKGVKQNGKWVKEPDKIKFMLLGADNPDALRGIYLDGCVLDEYAQCDPIVWGEIVRPALTDRLGWGILIGTPKGKNHFYDRFRKAESSPDWHTMVCRASETGIIPQSELDEMRRDMEKWEFQQEMECSFEAEVRGSYYGELIGRLEDNNRVGDFPYDPGYPVDTYWDLGIGDSLTVWFRQKFPGTFRYIDYLEVNGQSLQEIAKLIKEKPYAYGRHVLPWDARARELGTGLTRQETLRKHGIIAEIQKRQSVDDRIQATRIMLPKCVFNRETTGRGRECLQNYQKEWDPKLMMFKNKPKHDWASHGADSFGYSALDDRDSQFAHLKHSDLPREADGSYDELGGNYGEWSRRNF